jgi:hypothetical protein
MVPSFQMQRLIGLSKLGMVMLLMLFDFVPDPDAHHQEKEHLDDW